jgi:hypothetical protein
MSNVNGRSIDDGLAVGRRLLAAHEYHKAVQCHRLISLKFPRDVRGYMALGQAFRALGNRTKMSKRFVVPSCYSRIRLSSIIILAMPNEAFTSL